jgi:hypothetical protein
MADGISQKGPVRPWREMRILMRGELLNHKRETKLKDNLQCHKGKQCEIEAWFNPEKKMQHQNNASDIADDRPHAGGRRISDRTVQPQHDLQAQHPLHF